MPRTWSLAVVVVLGCSAGEAPTDPEDARPPPADALDAPAADVPPPRDSAPAETAPRPDVPSPRDVVQPLDAPSADVAARDTGALDATRDAGADVARPDAATTARVVIGAEIALGASNPTAVPRADVGPDGALRVVWFQGASPRALSYAFREVAADGTPGPLRTIPGSDASERFLPHQYGPRVAAMDAGRAAVMFATFASGAATWRVLGYEGGRFAEWARFPAQAAGATGAGEEGDVSVTDLGTPTARVWASYGYFQGDRFLAQARSLRAGATVDDPHLTVDRPWGKEVRYRAFRGEVWGVAQFAQLMVQHRPARPGAGTVNGWETVRCTIAPDRHPGSPRPLFDREGRPFLVYVEWETVSRAPRVDVPRQVYVATDPRDGCSARRPVGPRFAVAPEDALVVGRFHTDGFGLGDGRLFLAWQEQVGATGRTTGRLSYALYDRATGAGPATPIPGTENAAWVAAAGPTPDGGGYVAYRSAAGQLVARRVSLAR